MCACIFFCLVCVWCEGMRARACACFVWQRIASYGIKHGIACLNKASDHTCHTLGQCPHAFHASSEGVVHASSHPEEEMRARRCCQSKILTASRVKMQLIAHVYAFFFLSLFSTKLMCFWIQFLNSLVSVLFCPFHKHGAVHVRVLSASPKSWAQTLWYFATPRLTWKIMLSCGF